MPATRRSILRSERLFAPKVLLQGCSAGRWFGRRIFGVDYLITDAMPEQRRSRPPSQRGPQVLLRSIPPQPQPRRPGPRLLELLTKSLTRANLAYRPRAVLFACLRKVLARRGRTVMAGTDVAPTFGAELKVSLNVPTPSGAFESDGASRMDSSRPMPGWPTASRG